MKKNVAKQLHQVAGDLPLVFVKEPIVIQMTGYEMNLSAFGEVHKYDNDQLYDVEFFQLRAVEHKQQLKDAYKRGGINEAKKYYNQVNETYATDRRN